MDHTVLLANNTIFAFTCKRSQAAPPRIYDSERLSSTYYSFIDPQEDEWLSWHGGWLDLDKFPTPGVEPREVYYRYEEQMELVWTHTLWRCAI